MSNKQSSIDWLVSQILVEYATYFNEEGDLVDKPINQFFNAYQGSVNLIEYVNKAKEMHKEEIIDAYSDGAKGGANGGKGQHKDGWVSIQMKEKYYNKTFGK